MFGGFAPPQALFDNPRLASTSHSVRSRPRWMYDSDNAIPLPGYGTSLAPGKHPGEHCSNKGGWVWRVPALQTSASPSALGALAPKVRNGWLQGDSTEWVPLQLLLQPLRSRAPVSMPLSLPSQRVIRVLVVRLSAMESCLSLWDAGGRKRTTNNVPEGLARSPATAGGGGAGPSFQRPTLLKYNSYFNVHGDCHAYYAGEELSKTGFQRVGDVFHHIANVWGAIWRRRSSSRSATRLVGLAPHVHATHSEDVEAAGEAAHLVRTH